MLTRDFAKPIKSLPKQPKTPELLIYTLSCVSIAYMIVMGAL